MSDQHTLDRDRRHPQAAEYVLGVLGAAERRDFEGGSLSSPRSAPRSSLWEHRLGALASEVKPVAPPPETWTRIEAALQGTATRPRDGLWH